MEISAALRALWPEKDFMLHIYVYKQTTKSLT